MNSRGYRLWPMVILPLLTWLGSSECLDYRLGISVKPSFYNLRISVQQDVLNPAAPSYKFDGDVEITLQSVDADVSQITLHKDDIDITTCGLYTKGELVENIAIQTMSFEQATQQLTVPLTQALVVNQDYLLKFKYTGKVQTRPEGLFSSSYLDEETNTSKMVLITHMQAINARLVLPCFDEPIFKAKFQVTIERPSGFNAISNTKLIKTTDEGNNRFADQFDVTPIMSSYLLAFIISEYKARGNSTLAIYTRPSYYDHTSFSYSVAERALPAFNELFQQPYQELGNEVFQYATTPIFRHNSMENWGLVIFKDKVVLEEPGYTDGWAQKEFTIRNIVHENAHMWFGNSVTIAWWGFFWMQEGLARYYEFFIGHELYPEYQLDQQFVVHKLQHILTTDSLYGTQPLTSGEWRVQTPDEIYNKFSSISFAKGASFIRMCRNAMGSENFDRAVQNYLKEYHLQNTYPSQFVAHLKSNWNGFESDLDSFFGSFTVQEGYPVILVKLEESGYSVFFEQQRFLLNPKDGSDVALTYTVPITFATNQSPDFEDLTPQFFMYAGMYKQTFDKPIEWIIVNKKQSNYHRVKYTEPLVGRIQKALTEINHSYIPVENRAALVDDLFNFAHADMIDYVDVLKFMEYMSTETDYIPWYAAYEGLTRVSKRLTPQQLPNFNKYLSDITAAVYNKLGVSWSSNDKVLDVYNRNLQVAWLCKYQSEDCNNQVRQKFEADSEKPTPDYREIFYCAASRAGGYDRVLQYYEKETNAIDREPLLRASSCTRDYRTHYHNQIIGTGSGNDVSLKLIALAQLYEQNPDLITPIFQMVTEDITQLANALDSWPKTAQALSDMADYFTTSEQRTLLSDFYSEKYALFGSSAEILSKALTNVDSNLDWAAKRLGDLNKYLAQRNGAAGLATTSLLMLMMSTLVSFVLKQQ
ncbi:membrane alanyl aminopeptidase [Drosophila grimshawi]|uniref:Aminopeptidase n=1 Tax=Drosophila grimshawi TaxID=7222 RepID=B4JHI9_DROGR|nr:membrane alanyl aminopeptidase [Drosophila grimshawi]EDV92816.1 GH18622 [Drosophila grimshawi]